MCANRTDEGGNDATELRAPTPVPNVRVDEVLDIMLQDELLEPPPGGARTRGAQNSGQLSPKSVCSTMLLLS